MSEHVPQMGNDQKSMKLSKSIKNVQNLPKNPNAAENYQKCPNVPDNYQKCPNVSKNYQKIEKYWNVSEIYLKHRKM